MSVRLDPAYRAAALTALADTDFDVLVIGGGVVGAGAALDAASRGLSVALVETQDWAAGTSSRSSKLIHGGLRYLQQRDFALVREALQERSLMLRRIAPHLVHPVPFLYPLRHRVWERLYVGAGVLLYDTMGGAHALPWHRHLSRRRALELAPGLRADALTGAISYYDGQVDDARHTMALARTAAQHGATVLTRTEVVGVRYAGGRVVGATIRDHMSGREVVVSARRVVGAVGVWTDQLHHLARVPGQLRVAASKGVHLLVPRDRLPLSTGLIMRTERSVLLVIPWGQHWLIGTTDTPWQGDVAHPTVAAEDLTYLLEHLNEVLVTPLRGEDVHGVYAGLRPLLAATADTETTQLSREHAVAEAAPGLFVTAGGKYTTYRVMAADLIDAAVRDLGDVEPSVTKQLPLVGAAGYHELWHDRQRLADRGRLPIETVEHLLNRYGSAIGDLFLMLAEEPELADPIPGAEQYLKVEARYAVTHEGALHLDDVLSRRTRITIETPDGGLAAASAVIDVIAPVLGWDQEARRAELDRYRQQVAADRAAQTAAESMVG
ncbi:glycerol-3-phosphate dehydrogenase/oxidase [Natronosporangium hydrolyticum]|uniref:Glycerol-3-phosphate dehydrogenase n=1 Tax=Natronosporangium hydrolyticum TaxID=2811111 RepID=A0A895YCM8_9ACTN|nr:glycerol-3-phosphate dehydrogenase/oxidase [Natronosporangium hydrolyticum]QSB13942.1 glycerol-3-phosphate dehydrogenase/oxidase [Natronosporangium hydrolyticum]